MPVRTGTPALPQASSSLRASHRHRACRTSVARGHLRSAPRDRAAPLAPRPADHGPHVQGQRRGAIEHRKRTRNAASGTRRTNRAVARGATVWAGSATVLRRLDPLL